MRDAEGGVPWRFGENIPVDLGFDRGGLWETLADGTRVWRLGIRSDDAVSINLAFDVFVLPPGATLFVRSADGREVLGAFTDANNKADGRFATTWIFDDEIVLEYREPASAPYPGELSLLRVTHGYRTPKAGAEAAFNNSGSCQNNVNCPPLTSGWENQSRSVAKYLTGGGGLCTGALINNAANDGTPYFLTANHCYANPSYWVFHFNYEADGCSNPSFDPSYDSISGASHRASSSNSDFALVELSSDPPDSFAVYYSGWSRSSSAPNSAVCIHHPAGDIKKFSFEANQISGQSTMWDVGPWDDGTTEGGSSGSPLYNQDHRIVGQLYGGSSACWGSGENNGTDIYGRVDVSWTGGSSDSRLSDWLDPGNSGSTAIDGFDPTTPASPVDASVSVVEPADGSMHCDGSVPFEVQVTNAGSETLTAVDIDYRTDGGGWISDSWSGSLSPGQSTTVSLGSLTPGGGSHDVEGSVDASGGGGGGNDSTASDFSVGGGAGEPGADEDFSGGTFPPTGWARLNPDGAEAWTRTTSGGGGAAHFNNFDDDYRPQTDTLQLPFIDLTDTASPALQFDVAYARYNGEYSDGLRVRVSDDCGASWDTLYDKSGTTLATSSDHDEAFVPTSSEWRTETVSLNAYGSDDSVLIEFVNVTGYGNNLFVDDVLVGTPDAGDDDDASDDDDATDDDDDDTVPSDDDDTVAQDDDDPADDDDDAAQDDDDDDDGQSDLKAGEVYAVEPFCSCDTGANSAPGRSALGLLLGLLGLTRSRRRRA